MREVVRTVTKEVPTVKEVQVTREVAVAEPITPAKALEARGSSPLSQPNRDRQRLYAAGPASAATRNTQRAAATAATAVR